MANLVHVWGSPPIDGSDFCQPLLNRDSRALLRFNQRSSLFRARDLMFTKAYSMGSMDVRALPPVPTAEVTVNQDFPRPSIPGISGNARYAFFQPQRQRLHDTNADQVASPPLIMPDCWLEVFRKSRSNRRDQSGSSWLGQLRNRHCNEQSTTAQTHHGWDNGHSRNQYCKRRNFRETGEERTLRRISECSMMSGMSPLRCPMHQYHILIRGWQRFKQPLYED